MIRKTLLCFFAAIILCAPAFAQLRLPKIFSDNMVVQRERPLKVWGWASPGETVKLSFNGQSVQAKASKTGTWSVVLKSMTHGGPYEMKITSKSGNVNLKNILIGDVWLGSGQSNMEWTLDNTQNAAEAIAAANHPKIRLFTVEKDMSFSLKDDLKSGSWLECTPQNAAQFSAVAYYFGINLVRELDVPIGLINSSWGGTKVEPWISWELMREEPEYKNADLAAYEKEAKTNEEKLARYAEAVKNDPGINEKWFQPETSVSSWKPMKLPQEWSPVIGNIDGVVWFRKEFSLTSAQLESATLSLGAIDDADFTYLNGEFVGSETQYNKERVYSVDKKLLREGKNVLVVKVRDDQGGGGFVGRPDQMYLEVKGQRLQLDGEWLYRVAVTNADFKIVNMGPNAYASRLYNAMIAPIVGYNIRGVIWYQGESNTGAARDYTRLFPMLIKNWRQKWGYEFPFYWVQLANFMAPALEPGESQWAELREAQRMTLSLPKTGQAVIIDIGEANDIHPRNKKDVGYRLALNALAKEYGKTNLVYSGPVYKSMEVQGDKAVLSFDHIGSGLVAWNNKYGYVQGFAVAGEDKKFHWARAFIEGDKVVVYSPSVKNPVAVRYAWSDNPGDANLSNKEGIPASPFKTDDWRWTTDK